jgi:DNA-binding MarR family transcriptional regulator
MGQPSIGTGEEECNCSALRRAARRVSLLYDRHLAANGLTNGQYAILVEIDRRGAAAPTLGELAEALIMDRAALAHTLKPLERDGLIELTTDPTDRRARLVRITGQGRLKHAVARHAWRTAQAKFTASFGEDQAIALRALLRLVGSVDVGERH